MRSVCCFLFALLLCATTIRAQDSYCTGPGGTCTDSASCSNSGGNPYSMICDNPNQVCCFPQQSPPPYGGGGILGGLISLAGQVVGALGASAAAAAAAHAASVAASEAAASAASAAAAASAAGASAAASISAAAASLSAAASSEAVASASLASSYISSLLDANARAAASMSMSASIAASQSAAASRSLSLAMTTVPRTLPPTQPSQPPSLPPPTFAAPTFTTAAIGILQSKSAGLAPTTLYAIIAVASICFLICLGVVAFLVVRGQSLSNNGGQPHDSQQWRGDVVMPNQVYMGNTHAMGGTAVGNVPMPQQSFGGTLNQSAQFNNSMQFGGMMPPPVYGVDAHQPMMASMRGGTLQPSYGDASRAIGGGGGNAGLFVCAICQARFHAPHDLSLHSAQAHGASLTQQTYSTGGTSAYSAYTGDTMMVRPGQLGGGVAEKVTW